MSHADKEIYEFADFRLNVSERLLLEKGERVRLPKKTFDILCLLVRENNHLVGKDELLQKVWADTIVEENNLEKNISYLRHALGEHREGMQKFIETVRGSGYRFIGEVKRIEIEDEPKAAKENIKLISSTPKSQPIKSNEQDEHLHGESIGNVVALADWRREIDEPNQTNGALPEINPPKEFEQSVNVEAERHSSSESDKSEQALAAKPKIAHSQPKSRLRVRVAGALLLVAALTGIAYLSYLYLKPSPMKFQVGKMTRLTATGKIINAIISPDGKLVAYVQEENQDEHSLWLRHLASESNANITPQPKTKFESLTFSPDGNYLYYIFNNSLYQLPILGGAPKKILDNIVSTWRQGGISFSPDGKRFAFLRRVKKSETVTENSIVIVDADGTNEQVFYPNQSAPAYLRGSLKWSPDGKTIVARVFEPSTLTNVLAINVADKSTFKILPEGWVIISQIAWMPDSKSFLLIGMKYENEQGLHQIWRVCFPDGEAQRLNTDFNKYTTVSLTADGRFLASTIHEHVSHIWTMPSDDISQLKQVTTGFDKYDGNETLAWMPDGRIVYDSYLSGVPTVSVTNSDGSNSRQLANKCANATVSPDGRFFVCYKAKTVSEAGLFRIDLSDNSEMRLTNGRDVYPAFSPDGKYVVFKRFATNQTIQMLRINVNGGETNLITDDSNLVFPTISPDGKMIAFGDIVTKELVLIPIEGGEPIKKFDVKFNYFTSMNSKENFQWTPDGSAINYPVLKENVSNIWRQPIDGSPRQQITYFKDGLIFNYAFSPDGSQLALSRGTYNSDVVLIENGK